MPPADSSHEAPVRLTITPNEPAAELLCSILRSEDIRCAHRITDMAFGSGGEMPLSGGGAREVLVSPADLERARELASHVAADEDEVVE